MPDSTAFLCLSGDLLRQGLPIRFRAEGRSMWPAIRSGEPITVEPVDTSRVRVGDILLCLRGSGPIAHRVERIDRSGGRPATFTLRGDASLTSDAPVEEAAILGRVTGVERDGLWVSLAGPWERFRRGPRRTIRRALRGGPPSAASLRPEDEILFSCASPALTADEFARIRRLFGSGIDWRLLVRRARSHGLLGLLHRLLAAVGWEAVGSAERGEAAEWFGSLRRRNLFLAGELCRVLDRLGAHGIQAVPLKGAALAASAYGDIALRQFADIDVLVRPEDLARVERATAALGFRPARFASRESDGEILLARQGGAVFLEIHSEAIPAYLGLSRVERGLWDRLRPSAGGAWSAPALAAEDLLLLTSCHGAKHLWERLIWIADVAWLLRAETPFDSGRLLDRARSCGAEIILLTGLALAECLPCVRLPAGLEGALRANPRARALAREILERIARGPEGPPTARERFSFHYRMRERWFDRLSYAARLALRVSPRDRELLRLPAPLAFLYPVWRWMRLAGEYGLRLGRSPSHGTPER